MKEIRMYEAPDGETFDTREECLEYEKENFPSKEAFEKLYLFDNKLTDIKDICQSDDWLSYGTIYDNLHWFIIKKVDQDSLSCITRILDYGPYSYPEKFVEGDIYTFSADGWYNYSAEFEEMKNTFEMLSSLMNA